MDEFIQVLKRMWDDKPFDFDGRYYKVEKDGPEDQSVGWITMVVSDERQRAWLYFGYQN